MTVWAVLAGALAAGILAWAAIAGFAWAGDVHLRTRPIRLFGAAALAVLALGVAGLPIPWIAAPSLLGVGILAGLVPPVWRDEDT